MSMKSQQLRKNLTKMIAKDMLSNNYLVRIKHYILTSNE